MSAQEPDVGTAAEPSAGPATNTVPAPGHSTVNWPNLIDSVIVIVLALASMFAAWAGYQAGNWNQAQSASTIQAERVQIDATRATTIGYQVMQIDLSLFLNWLNAYKTDNQTLATFYEERFSPQLETAFAAWLATDPFENPDAPTDPFRMDIYAVPQLEAALTLDAEVEQAFADAAAFGALGDAYVLSTLLLAVVLFFGGISTKIGWRPAQIVLIGAAVVLLLYCVQDLAVLPDGSNWGLTPLW